MPCVGVGTPSLRPSSTTLPPSQGNSRRLPRSRSSAIDAFMAGGTWLVKSRIFSSASAGRATRLARPRHDAGVAGEQDELHPQLGQDLLAQGRVETGFQAKREKILSSRAALAVELTEYHAHEGADLLDPAGADDRRADLRHAAHHGAGPKDRDQPLGGVDAVLQRDDRGVGTDQRPDPEARAFDVPQLDAKQHDVDFADFSGIVGGPGRHQMGLAAAAL